MLLSGLLDWCRMTVCYLYFYDLGFPFVLQRVLVTNLPLFRVLLCIPLLAQAGLSLSTLTVITMSSIYIVL